MNRNSDAIFNAASIVFLVLSLLLCLVSVVWLVSDSAVPDFLAPATEGPVPTQRTKVTFTPSYTPSSPPATWTPTPDYLATPSPTP